MGIKISEATAIVDLKDSYMIPLGNVGNDEANATKLGVLSDYVENGIKTRDVFVTTQQFDNLNTNVEQLQATVGNSEQWTFELEDGSLITKEILIK